MHIKKKKKKLFKWLCLKTKQYTDRIQKNFWFVNDKLILKSLLSTVIHLKVVMSQCVVCEHGSGLGIEDACMKKRELYKIIMVVFLLTIQMNKIIDDNEDI